MKIAITGKGGVGKTTTSSLLAWTFAAEGKKVIAIDANPDANLATALGFSTEEVHHITPIAELKELIEERTGAKSGSYGTFFKANPKVDDIPERFSLQKNGIKLLVMGTVKRGGSGCLCPEATLIKSLLSHLVLSRSEVVIMDMDAGVENLGRKSSRCFYHHSRTWTKELPNSASYTRFSQRYRGHQMLYHRFKMSKQKG
jgi:CO dehydrogenase maturation factor